MEINNFFISVPWGHVAVKAWGDKENQPVLVVHGIQDNAGFFDYLIPYLPKTFYYICIDLPGHGMSSHFPLNTPLHLLNYVYALQIVLDNLNRKKYIIIAHSFGGQISLTFSQLYPEYVTKLILIDILFFGPTPPKNLEELRHVFEKQINLNLAGKQPIYSFDEIVKKASESRRAGPVPLEVASKIMKRSLIKIGEDKYKVSTDPRLKFTVRPLWTDDYVIKSLKYYPIRCPVLLILPNESGLPSIYPNDFVNSVLNELKQDKLFTLNKIEGTHDCHVLAAEKTSQCIIKFLKSSQSKL